MAYVLADHIISPLGKTSEENYQAVKAGLTGIQAYPSGSLQMPDAFMASLNLAGSTSLDSLLENDFERMAFYSAFHAMQTAGMKMNGSKVVFILSSTKGNVERLTPLADSAERIASHLCIDTKPIVVCNACISGLAALILADRLLAQGRYDVAVVCGCDVPRRFIISGFHALKALSSEHCRPFDMERFGLNLGEAAATIVLGREPQSSWQIGRGYVKNDAFHISAPSKTSQGLYSALMESQKGLLINDLAFINAHGTATLFNDQMESIAIQRAGLSEVPLNALKGYFGHTLGAAGIMETILSMKAVDDHCIPGTRGFEELGVSGKVNISALHRPTDKHNFVKMLAGFGGCNATLVATKDFSKESLTDSPSESNADSSVKRTDSVHFQKRHLVRISPEGVTVDGEALLQKDSQDLCSQTVSSNARLLTDIYKQYIGNYPKYYKMDGLSRLGFVAAELLLRVETEGEAETSRQSGSAALDDMAIVFFNHSSSVDVDRKYMSTITDKENYFPSPSLFVYTLPNIVAGEIAIRHKLHGETSFYILPDKDEQLMNEILMATFEDKQTKRILAGWLNYDDDEHFEAEINIMYKQK